MIYDIKLGGQKGKTIRAGASSGSRLEGSGQNVRRWDLFITQDFFRKELNQNLVRDPTQQLKPV